MFKSLVKVISVFAILFIVVLPIDAAENSNSNLHAKILESASELDYPPFALVREDGTADGFSVDLLKESIKAAGLKIRFNVGPWHIIKQKLIDGELDVLPLVSYSKERDKVFDYSASYLRLHGTIFVRKGNSSIQEETDLINKEVITMQGDVAQEYAIQNKLTNKLILTDTYEEAMKLLASGKHDAVLMLQLVGFQLLEKLNISNIVSIHSFQDTNLKPIDKPLSGFEQRFCFAVPEGNKELLSLLNEGLAIVIANGTYNELYDKWFGPILPQPDTNWPQIFQYVFSILFPVLFLSAVLGIWYLKKQVALKTKYLKDEIQERKQAEQTLQVSENKFRKLFNVAGIPLCYVDNNGVILDFNTKFTKVFGYTKSDIPTLDLWWVLAYPDPDYRKWVIKTWEATVKKAQQENSEIKSVEYRVTCKNGEIKNIIISGTIFGEHFLATFIDFTDLKIAEERFERFFSLISDIFCIADIHGCFRLINPAAQEILGYSKDELLGRPWMEFVHSDDRNKTITLIQEKLDQGHTVFNFINRYICKDGSIKWLEWTSHPIQDQGITYAVARDCTARLKMEAAIKASELWLRNVFNSFEEALLVVSPSRVLLNMNQATLKMFGYTEDELRTQSTSLLHIDEDHYAQFEKKIQAAFDQGKAAEFEFQAKRKNGEIFPSEHTVSLLKDETGDSIGIVSVIRDISKRKEAERLLEKTLADLERSNSELQQFAYVASHDLQEPLRAIVGFLQLLQSRYMNQLDEKGLHYIDRAVKAGHRMQGLITGLLTLSRVNTQELVPEKINLNELIQDINENLQSAYKKNQGQLICSELPDLNIDKNQILSLFQNLIVNALKYNENKIPIIEISYQDKGDAYCFSVKDNGIGIAPQFHERIFMIFQRLHTRDKYPGTGIGLSLCKKIVERYGGRIWVESEKEKGSIFLFTLPKERT